jgi:signal transduction histidine kinase
VSLIGRLSLRWKVPALLAIVLAAAVTTFGLMAYGVVRRAAIAAAVARQASVADQIAQLAQAGLGNLTRQVAEVASEPALVSALRDPANATAMAAAHTTLARLARDSALLVSVELRDREEKQVDAVGRPVPVRKSVVPAVSADSVSRSGFYLAGDRVVYDVRAPVRDGDRHIGWVVVVRPPATTGQGVRVLAQLIGEEAVLLLGNADGSFWTDLRGPVQRPVPSLGGIPYERDGRRRLSAAVPLPRTPWVLAVEMPEDVVLAPTRALLRNLAVLAVVIVVAAALAGERLTRSITAPIVGLTARAESIAGGSPPLPAQPIHRQDEIGRLARAFAVMADSVRQAREHLESQIGERTAELERALAQLQQAQDELLRKERLAMLGQLSSSIGHEMRNPLGVMNNAVYYLEMTLPDAPPKVKEYLALIRGQIRLSERIVSDLLDSTRSRPPESASVAVPDLLDEQLARVTIPRSVRVERDLASDLPRAWVDPDHAGQILVNLVTNAIQAMDGTGGMLRVRAHGRDGRVCIEVEDSGPGVPVENLEKIFEPLFTTKARGIGLGLSVSRSLARANEGDLTVRNLAGAGAVFLLDLPADTRA